MGVNYKSVPKKNPGNQAAPAKYYAQVVSSGEMTLRDLAKQISLISTVSTADTMAVLENLLTVIPMAMADGKIVRLGEFGSYNLTVKSDGTATEAELSVNQIKKRSVKFRAGKIFMKAINDIEFKKI
jgi:predicted histone-like DNA-binding protein